MKTMNKTWLALASICVSSLIIVVTALTALSQTAPVLTIAPSGTNGISITVSNAIPADSYEVWWTPVLGNTASYPWTLAAPGTIGETNFLLPNWEYPTVFFRGLLDTNAVPLWESANPGNPASPILNVTIASPANGSSLN
jgi:hypothetical protein